MSTRMTWESAARAWFPAPEFLSQVQYSPHNFALNLRIVHVESRWCVDKLVEMEEDSPETIDHIIGNLSSEMHTQLAVYGRGGVYDPGGLCDPGVVPLIQLMGFEFIARDVQGTLGENGMALWLVRRGAWAAPVRRADLEKPLSWWQEFVRSLTQNPGLHPSP